MKYCSECSWVRDFFMLTNPKKKEESNSMFCKRCTPRIRVLTERPKKPKKVRESYYSKHKAEIKARSKEYYNSNKDKCKEGVKTYRSLNKGYSSSVSAKRRAAKLQATPKWLTVDQLNEILGFYILAESLTLADGVKRHVDHLVPLQGKTVCGLHVPWNLQVLTATENISKGNKI